MQFPNANKNRVFEMLKHTKEQENTLKIKICKRRSLISSVIKRSSTPYIKRTKSEQVNQKSLQLQ